MIDTDGKFYLGKIYDLSTKQVTEQLYLYDPEDLTTHAVVVGMTGSGKTGLCIDLLEEAALNNIPALMIDPKGDITNALLHFPDLLPADFQPWVNSDEARREGKTVEQAAVDVANLWKNGLAKWGIGSERIRALQNAAEFAIYTPGSDAGIPVSILANLQAPQIPWEGNKELLLEKISGTVTAILGLVGFEDVDPVRSREHILLSNIFEHAWRQGKDLDLGELILQTQNPPFKKLGVFDVNTFFPEKDRFDLAMLLNNILASPSFQTWIEGQPLDIPSLLYAADGRPRHSVFYIAHLSDAERMFFVTLLYSAVETWMRTQKGTTSLRAIIYFDEIFGYLPPVQNPPSKMLMLRMLKQGRAFGVGQVLVTQNPVDVDYKGLSNAGSWFIGKLQTERDKERLLDGLQGASPTIDRQTYDRMISSLGKRVFLAHNVHEKQPYVFHTRWAMNYLTGPLTRAQIPALNQMVGAGSSSSGLPSAEPAAASSDVRGVTAVPTPNVVKAVDEMEQYGTTTRPAVPGRVAEYFLPNNLTLSEAAKRENRPLSPDAQTLGLLYKPVLLAQASIRYLKRNYNLDLEDMRTAVVLEVDRRGVIRWEDWLSAPINPRSLDRQPAPGARFTPLEAPLDDAKVVTSLKSDFMDWVYRNAVVKVRANEQLEVYVPPDASQAEFRKQCSEAASRAMEEEIAKLEDSYERKLRTLRDRLEREERELREDEAEYQQRKMEELGTHAENVLGLFTGSRRRKLSSSLSKRRMTEKAKADVDESIDAIEQYKKDIAALERERDEEIQRIREKWAEIADDMTEIPVQPYKKDILLDLFGIAWFPYYLVESDGHIINIAGFSAE